MTDYQYEYKQALRNGNEEEANKIYREHLRENSSEEPESRPEEAPSESEEEKFEDPADMNVSEAKDYADKLDEEATQRFLDMEKEGKDRKSLVSYLE